jgi:hypothetical protein
MFYRHLGAGASMSQGISEQDISKQEAEEQKTSKPTSGGCFKYSICAIPPAKSLTTMTA